ncbi:MAG: hypothetical protein ACLFRY_02020 [Spirochaetia bacterium]
MKRFVSTILILFILTIGAAPVYGYNILYAEQFYRLYRMNLYQYPEDALENIFWLERSLRADFANPLNALARIETPEEWARYRSLFRMHVNLKLVEQYILLASKYDKRNAYFFNEPWKEINLKSLEKARKIYSMADYYWEEALRWSAEVPYSFTVLEDVQFWEDENHRISTGDLDYREIINKHLNRVNEVIEGFEEMDEDTY